MLGNLPLPATDRNFWEIAGGSFYNRPETYVGVNLAREVMRPADYRIAIDDFSHPTKEQVDEVIVDVVRHILKGERVYVGCMGGRGRTGLFLAILAKVFGQDNPVAYVRRHYNRHAVETAAQRRFVNTYQAPSSVIWMLRWARFKARFRRGGCLTI